MMGTVRNSLSYHGIVTIGLFSVGCPFGYQRLGQDFCYLPECPMLNFKEAKKFCESRNGSLAVLNSISEAEAVLEWLKAQDLAHRGFWNGLVETKTLNSKSSLSMEAQMPFQCQLINDDVKCQRPDEALAVCEAELVKYDEKIVFTDEKLVIIGGGVFGNRDFSTMIIDLSGNGSGNCFRNAAIGENPFGVGGAAAAFIGGRVLVCGGNMDFDTVQTGTEACYKLTSDFQWQRETFNVNSIMVRPGYLKVNDNKFIIAGGMYFDPPVNGTRGQRHQLKSVEIYEEDKKSFRSLPDLPNVQLMPNIKLVMLIHFLCRK